MFNNGGAKMSRVVIIEANLNLTTNCVDALMQLAVTRPEMASLLVEFKNNLPNIVGQCVDKAVRMMEARGIRTGHRRLFTNGLPHGIEVHVDVAGKIRFTTSLRDNEEKTAKQQAEFDLVVKQFSAATITAFYAKAVAQVSSRMVMKTYDHDGHRIVHLQGVCHE